jgi:hypothetical protein
MSFPPNPDVNRLRHQRDDLEQALDQTIDAARKLFIQIERSAEPVPASVWEALRSFYQAEQQATRGRSPRHAAQFARLAAIAQAGLRRRIQGD